MKKILSKIALSLLVIGGWIVFDLLVPHKADIRYFDAAEIARLDTAMWRSYYNRERVKLYSELTELLEKQYKLNFWRRHLIAYRAAKATFVFKDGKSRTDYEKALPDLEKFYASIRDISTTDFDAKCAARLELEWWIVRRERKKYQESDLANALAETASAVYNLPKEVFTEHGRLRAEAMNIRDNEAETGGVTEEDWQKIDELLHQSWRSLHNAVSNK